MSTPRRSWPRSIGTPRTPTGVRLPPGGLSSKGHATGASGIGGGLEEAIGGAACGVDPAEEHRGLVIGEDPLVGGEIRLASACLIGEEVALSVQARGSNGGLEREPKDNNIYEGLQDCRGDAGGTGRTQGDDIPVRGRDNGRAHAGDQALARV